MKNKLSYEDLSKIIREMICESKKPESSVTGEDLERGIELTWNGKPLKGIKPPVSKQGCEKIVSFMRKEKGVPGEVPAHRVGRVGYEVTPFWAQHFGGNVPASTKTPKTDLIIGDYKISLKAGRGQLMSAGKAEAAATFYAALSTTPDVSSVIAKRILKSMEGMALSSFTDSDLTTAIKSGKDKLVMRANESHKNIMMELRRLFEKNENFARSFVFEAMSGMRKFGGGQATCNYVLVSDYDGKKIEFEELKSDSDFVMRVVNRTDLSVGFKTRAQIIKGKKTGKYRYWSAISLIANYVERLDEEYFSKNKVLSEGQVMNYLKRLKDWVVNLFRKIEEWLSESFENVMDFLEVEPEVSYEIDFTSV